MEYYTEFLNYFEKKTKKNKKYEKTKYFNILEEWIEEIYESFDAEFYYQFINDICLISHFPSDKIIDILYHYSSHISFNYYFNLDIAKYIYKMWKEYKLLDDKNNDLKTAIKLLKNDIKKSIIRVSSIKSKNEYHEFILLNHNNYDPDVFGSCGSPYYKWTMYIYIPLLKNYENIITNLLNIAFLDDAQEYLLTGLMILEPNELFKVTKNMLLQLITQNKKSFDPFLGSPPGPAILSDIVKKLYNHQLYLLNDLDIINACNNEYGENFLIDNELFGKYIIGNEEHYKNMYLYCDVCHHTFGYHRDENNNVYILLNKENINIMPECNKCNIVICDTCTKICYLCAHENNKCDVICKKCDQNMFSECEYCLLLLCQMHQSEHNNKCIKNNRHITYNKFVPLK